MSVSAVMFCEQFSAYTVHIKGLLSYGIHKHSNRSQYISVF